jgi:hypothetical protein
MRNNGESDRTDHKRPRFVGQAASLPVLTPLAHFRAS